MDWSLIDQTRSFYLAADRDRLPQGSDRTGAGVANASATKMSADVCKFRARLLAQQMVAGHWA